MSSGVIRLKNNTTNITIGEVVRRNYSQTLLKKEKLEFTMGDSTAKVKMEVIKREDPTSSQSKEVTAPSSQRCSINLRTLVSSTTLTRVRYKRNDNYILYNIDVISYTDILMVNKLSIQLL